MFENLAKDTTIKDEEPRDSLGGFILPTGIYPCTIDMAYMSKSKKGADAVNLELKTTDGRKIKQTIYITNRSGEPFYKDKNDGSKRYLPGYNQVNSICDLAVGQDISTVAGAAEEKTIKVWDFDAKAEIPKSMPVLLTLLNKKIVVGVLNIKENKNVQSGDGNWVPGPETRNINEINKAFNESGLTQAEIKAGSATPEFLEQWKEKYKNNEIDKSSTVAGGATAGVPGQATAVKEPPPLFSN
jgi:hypothetical protein